RNPGHVQGLGGVSAGGVILRPSRAAPPPRLRRYSPAPLPLPGGETLGGARTGWRRSRPVLPRSATAPRGRNPERLQPWSSQRAISRSASMKSSPCPVETTWAISWATVHGSAGRSEERRVGKEGRAGRARYE